MQRSFVSLTDILIIHVRAVYCDDARRKSQIPNCDQGIFEAMTQIAGIFLVRNCRLSWHITDHVRSI